MDYIPLGFVRLFHVTPAKNAANILKRGILPSRSKGKYRRIWLCDGDRLNWALVHVARHHRTSPDRMRVFSLVVVENLLLRLRPGVYVCKYPVAASCLNLTA